MTQNCVRVLVVYNLCRGEELRSVHRFLEMSEGLYYREFQTLDLSTHGFSQEACQIHKEAQAFNEELLDLYSRGFTTEFMNSKVIHHFKLTFQPQEVLIQESYVN